MYWVERRDFWGGKTLPNQPLGSPRIRWENEIDMNCREIGCKSGMFVELAGGGVV